MGKSARITLRPPGGLWSRLWDRACGRRPLEPSPPNGENVDFSLVSHVASEHVRRFVEAIEDYQLLSRRSVRVVSSFRMPDNAGLEETIPVWLSERIRFGIVGDDGRDFHYATLEVVELEWDAHGTDLTMIIAERIAPGTRAFIAAYLGDGTEVEALRDLPLTALPGTRHDDR